MASRVFGAECEGIREELPSYPAPKGNLEIERVPFFV